MIISALLTLFFGLLSLLLAPIPSLPSFPPEISSYLDQVSSYISTGASIINAYTYGSVLAVMVSLSLLLFAFYELYIFVMWILKKIPMVGIE